MSPSLLDFLRHIAHECDYLMDLRAGHDRVTLIHDPTYSRAIVRSLEVIGEAIKKLPLEFRTKSYMQLFRVRADSKLEHGLVKLN